MKRLKFYNAFPCVRTGQAKLAGEVYGQNLFSILFHAGPISCDGKLNL